MHFSARAEEAHGGVYKINAAEDEEKPEAKKHGLRGPDPCAVLAEMKWYGW